MASDLSKNLLELLKHNNRLHVHVKPGARKTEILAIDPLMAMVKVSVKEPPEDGKANIELERYLSKLSGKEARVVAGKTSRRKTVVFK